MKHKSSFEAQKKISKNDLLMAAEHGVISVDQVERLWETFSVDSSSVKPSRMLQFMYYFGALLVISAMTWFMTLGWNWFGGGGLFLIAFCYGSAFFACGYLLWQKKEFRVPSGLLATVAVCMVPLAIFGLEKYFGLWPENNPGNYSGYYTSIQGSWIFMEVGTILAGLIAVKYVRFPFMTAPIAASFWFLSIDFTPVLFGALEFTWIQECWVSLFFGLGMLSISYLIDRKSNRNFAFWGYLFGTLSFWGGLSLLAWTSELNWLLYFIINLVMMVGSIFLKRNILMTFGALGVIEYLGHLAYQVFKNSIMFPFALSFVGVMMIVLGILYHKNASKVRSSLLALLNGALR